jgi:Mg-chelatase subunit ChlD
MELSIGTINVILDLSLQDSLMLLFLIGLTAVSFYLMKRMRKDRVTKLGNYKTLKEVHDSTSIGSPVILGAKILVVSTLFLTATESIQVEAQQPVTDVEYVLTVDSSQSMLIPDYEPDRIGYAKDRLENWVNNLPLRANISVLSFSSETTTRNLPTMNTDRTVSSLREISVDLNRSGTNLTKALRTSLEVGETSTDRRVLVITDGRNIREEDQQSSLELARETSAEIYFFDIPRNNETEQLYRQLNLSLAEAGIDSGVTREVSSTAGLQRIAQESGGSYYRVDDSDFFQAALDDTTTETEKLGINSSFYILIFISFFVIFEMLLYSKYGAL